MALCRHYVRELRRSVLFETPDANADNATGGGSKSKRSSQILHDFEPPPGGGKSGSIRSGRSQDQRLSAFLRQESASNHKDSGSQHGSAHKDSSESRGDSVGERTPGTPGQQSGMSATLGRSKSRDTTPAGGLEQPRPSFMTSNLGDGSSPSGNHSSPHHTVNRSDIRASAEKILYVYVLPGSEREIVLPQNILDEIVDSIETQGRDDPEVFDAAKEYVFQAMEKDAFPGFLLAKAFGNLVPPSLMIRLIIGILSMFGAWWAAFSVLFLDKDRLTRLWVRCTFPYSLTLTLSLSTAASEARTARAPFPPMLIMKVLTCCIAHPPLHTRNLLPLLPPIHARPHPSAGRLQRDHLLQLRQSQRAFC